jgi:nucleotide-binding universal stress UspA family protein
MSATTALGVLAAIWVGVGLLLAVVMGRHGQDPFAWWPFGSLLGPLAFPLAISAHRRWDEQAWLVRSRWPGRGPVDVLVGAAVRGLAATAAALAAALDLLGPRLGRLSLVTVTDRDASVEHDRAQARGRAELERQGRLVQLRLPAGQHASDDGRRVPALVVAAGHRAQVLSRLAAEGGDALLVVGSRGAGPATVLLGNTATALAAHAKMPVLVAGGGSSPAGRG